jgi:hypothetical protein
MKKTYRIEVTLVGDEQQVFHNMDRGEVRDKVDSLLFNLRASRIESIYIRFIDGTRVVVIEE